jgi:beta-glucosidase
VKLNKLIVILSLALLKLSYANNYQKFDDIYTNHAAQAEQIYTKMTLDEKLGQLLVPSYVLLANSVSPTGELCDKALRQVNGSDSDIIKNCGLNQISQFHLGAVLTGGGPFYNAPTLANWKQLNDLAKTVHSKQELDPLLLTGNDAIHINMHVQGGVMGPHQIGLGVTHDSELVKQIAYVTGKDSLFSGFNWVYMPTVAVVQDLRWGRSYEGFGEPSNIKIMANAYISGLQEIESGKLNGALATAKHFIGDGATDYGLDEGNVTTTDTLSQFWLKNGSGYEAAVDASVGSIMVSYNSINDNPMHFGGKWDIINQFTRHGIVGSDKNLYQFRGFTVSDWNAVTRAKYLYEQANHTQLSFESAIAMSINSGVDVLMIAQGDNQNPFDLNSPANFTSVADFIKQLKLAYTHNLISEARLHEAVTRILRVKLALKPTTAPFSDYAQLQKKERELALQAAEEATVLLKNDNKLLPLNKAQIKNVVFVGDTNDIGIQNGGWTIQWQGQKGSQYFEGKDKVSSGAVSLEEGVQQALAGQKVNFYRVNSMAKLSQKMLNNAKDTIVIAVVAEPPYAEYMGDIANSYKVDPWYTFGAQTNANEHLSFPQRKELSLNFTALEARQIKQLRTKGAKVITVAYSGRPIILTDDGKTSYSAPLNNSDAVIAGFLPGTLGGLAISNQIFGDYLFRSKASGKSNTLTFPWPRDMKDIENHFKAGSLFPTGYGLAS